MGVKAEKFGGALERTRQQRDGIRKKESLVLRVPDYEDLQVRYKLMSEKVTEVVAKRIEAAERSEKAKALDVVCDFLIEACGSIEVRDDTGTFDVLVDDEDQPVRFDENLAEFLGFEFETAKDIVLETFSPKGENGLRCNPDATMDHFRAISSWRRGRSFEIDQALLGE